MNWRAAESWTFAFGFGGAVVSVITFLVRFDGRKWQMNALSAVLFLIASIIAHRIAEEKETK